MTEANRLIKVNKMRGIMSRKVFYKTDDLFWNLLRRSGVKEQMAQAILTAEGKYINSEKISLAEELTGDAIDLGCEAWSYFYKLNKITTSMRLTADAATKSIIRVVGK